MNDVWMFTKSLGYYRNREQSMLCKSIMPCSDNWAHLYENSCYSYESDWGIITCWTSNGTTIIIANEKYQEINTRHLLRNDTSLSLYLCTMYKTIKNRIANSDPAIISTSICSLKFNKILNIFKLKFNKKIIRMQYMN